MLAGLSLALWLDLRGRPCADDLTAMLDLYGGVRKRMDKAGLPPPAGAAVTGVVHLEADLEEEDGEDGGLSVLAVGARGRLLHDGEPSGVALTAGGSKQSELVATTHEAIRRPEAFVALMGKEKPVLTLFDFALSRAQHCRRISGCETVLLAEVQTAAALSALRRAELEDDAGVPIAAVLRPDVRVWFDALQAARE